MNFEQCEELTNDVGLALDEADHTANLPDTRHSADEIFYWVRRHLRESPLLHIPVLLLYFLNHYT